jgi:hypothetical protein
MKNTDISFHLPKIENKILQLKAICDINISKTALLKVINSSNIKLLLKKNMQNPLLNDILESAVNKKILNQKQIFDNPRIIHLYSIIASSGEDKDDNFKAISDNGVLVHNLRSLVYFNDAELFNQEISQQFPENFKNHI